LITTAELCDAIVDALEDIKATDIQLLDVSKLTDITSAMIICTATSSRHLQAVANHLVSNLKEQGITPLKRQSRDDTQWLLVDYNDVIVHVMLAEAREFYALEKLWLDTDLPIAAEA
jgi:ribosome-associated protein